MKFFNDFNEKWYFWGTVTGTAYIIAKESVKQADALLKALESKSE